MAHAKKKSLGRVERVVLLRAWCGDSIDVALAGRRTLACEFDDIVDAFVALWSAERIARGQSVVIPIAPPKDSVGLRMEMVA